MICPGADLGYFFFLDSSKEFRKREALDETPALVAFTHEAVSSNGASAWRAKTSVSPERETVKMSRSCAWTPSGKEKYGLPESAAFDEDDVELVVHLETQGICRPPLFNARSPKKLLDALDALCRCLHESTHHCFTLSLSSLWYHSHPGGIRDKCYKRKSRTDITRARGSWPDSRSRGGLRGAKSGVTTRPHPWRKPEETPCSGEMATWRQYLGPGLSAMMVNMVRNIDRLLLTPLAPTAPLTPAVAVASPASVDPSPAATDQVTLGASTPPPRSRPTQMRATQATGGLTDHETIDRLAHQMAPILQQMVPKSVLDQVAGILAGAGQELGKPAPPVTPEEASLFISELGVEEFTAKATERMAEATPAQQMQLMAAGQALVPVLEKAAADGTLGQVVASPPPEMNAFVDAYLAVGVPTPEEINTQVAAHPPGTPAEALQKATGRVSVPGQSVQLFVDGKTAYPEMERLLQSAKHSILMETYTWHDDETGRRMADLLIARKSEGIDVRVIYDSVGQNSYGPDRPKQNLALMAAAGIEVMEFNRDLLGVTGVNLSHRKLLIADGKAAMTGGMNIGNNYRFTWHDSMMRVDGSVAGDLAKEYAYDWERAGGKTTLPVVPSGSSQPLSGTAEIAVTVSSPRQDDRGREIRKGMLAAVDAAKSSIWIENPYFSDAHLVAHLQAAQQRGVQVNVILPQGNDEPVFTELNAISSRKLVADGAKVHMIDTGSNNTNFNHTKMIMVDDSWVMMGSANMDARSFEENQELTLGITDPDLARDIHQHMVGPDVLRSVDFTPGTPPANVRLMELVGTFL